MARLTWDNTGERMFEIGISNVVLYVKNDDPSEYAINENQTAVTNYAFGVPWSGVVTIDEKIEGADPTDIWTEDYKYDALRAPEIITGSIEAYTYPNDFSQCDGSVAYRSGIWIGQQKRKNFAICYRTENANDTDGIDGCGYKIHIIYNASASPSERNYETFNDSPEATKLEWEFTTTPVLIPGYGYANGIVFDTAHLSSDIVATLENCLYGTATSFATLPDPEYLLNFVGGAIYIDNTVVDTNNSDAKATDLLAGKSAFVKGTRIVGQIPLLESQTYMPGSTGHIIGAGYYLQGAQYILGDANLVGENIKAGVSIFGVDGAFIGDVSDSLDTSDATATKNDILDDKTAYVNGKKVVGNIEMLSASTYMPGTSRKTIVAGYYLAGDQIIEGDSNLIGANIRPGVSIFGVSGNISSIEASSIRPSTASIVLSGGYYLSGDQIIMGDSNLVGSNIRPGTTIFGVVGTMSSIAGSSYTPSATSRVISGGYYLAGSQIIEGDSNLIGANIRSGATIFGVVGTFEGAGGGIDTTDATARSADILYGKTAYVNGSKITGTITSRSASTFVPTTYYQTVSAGVYLTGSQIIAGDQNLIGENIKPGVSIFGVEGTMPYINSSAYMPRSTRQYIFDGQYLAGVQTILGDSNLVEDNIKYGVSIFGVTGTFSGIGMSGLDTTDATATINDILYGKTAYVNGSKITGNIYTLQSSVYIPGSVRKYVWSGYYLEGSQIIEGDENLIGDNIKSGISIFGVVGTYEGGATILRKTSDGYVILPESSKIGTVVLQSKTVTPGVSALTVVADDNYDGLYEVNVGGESRLTSENIKCGVSLFGVVGTYTGDATAKNSDIIMGKTAYVNGSKVTGLIQSIGAQTYIPSSTSQSISSGYYLAGTQTISGDRNLIGANIRTGVSIFGIAGTYTNDATAIANDILYGKTAYVNGSKVTGLIQSIGAQTYTPSSTSQSISSGYYLAGVQTINGDANLIGENIKSGVTIFGVAGTCEGGNGLEDEIITGAFPNGYYSNSRISTIREYAFISCSTLVNANFPSCETIGSCAFSACVNLVSISFPLCTSIGISAFYACSGLITASFPSCTSLGTSTFRECENLNDIHAPLCSTIGAYDFVRCKSLTVVDIPSCKSIGANAFGACTALVDISFPVCTSIGVSTFYNCSSLANVSIPLCEEIAMDAFYSCSSLTNVTFPSCTEIGRSAFYSCKRLSSVSFPLCTEIGTYAFGSCLALREVNFPLCVSIGSSAFYSCITLANAIFPSCTMVKDYAFWYCTNLAMASFPLCESIGRYAFSACYNLLSVYLLGSSVAALSQTNAFLSTPISTYTTSTGGVRGSIFVRASLLNDWKTATNWINYSDRFVGLTDEEISEL